MSSLSALVRRRVAKWFVAPRQSTHPDTMSLHDWADLPPHHPLCEPAPR